MTDLIEVRGLEKSFGDQLVLKGVDFTAGSGTVSVLLGPSGSGKTTVLRSMNVLETPDSGLVRISDASLDFGSPPTDTSAYRRAVRALRARSGMVFQSHHLFPHKTVLENLLEGPVQVQRRDVDEATAEAPVPPRTFTVMSGVPAGGTATMNTGGGGGVDESQKDFF